MVWKDITSYSRSEERIPSWWAIAIPGLRISVGNRHLYYPDGTKWLMHCEPWFNTHVLQASSLEEAQTEAITLVKDKLLKALNALQ